MNRIILLLLLIIFIILVSGCSLQEPSIGDITSNPERYDGTSVVLSGRVIGVRTDASSITDIDGQKSVIRSSQYTLTDISGGITVRTNSTPHYWDTVKISGVVEYSTGSCPSMPPPPGFYRPTSICTYVVIDENSRSSINCEELPPFPTTYSQDSYHIQLCPVNLTNCNVTRGKNCTLNIQCEDGRTMSRGAWGEMEVQYPPIYHKPRYIKINRNGMMKYGDFTLTEASCLTNMVMFY